MQAVSIFNGRGEAAHVVTRFATVPITAKLAYLK
jgi:hypothetical protein